MPRENPNLKERIEDAYYRIFDSAGRITEEEKLLNMIKSAKEDWERAESRFNEVTDKDLIDHTIYDMQAAKTRYTYLIKIAKEKGLNGNLH